MDGIRLEPLALSTRALIQQYSHTDRRVLCVERWTLIYFRSDSNPTHIKHWGFLLKIQKSRRVRNDTATSDAVTRWTWRDGSIDKYTLVIYQQESEKNNKEHTHILCRYYDSVIDWRYEERCTFIHHLLIDIKGAVINEFKATFAQRCIMYQSGTRINQVDCSSSSSSRLHYIRSINLLSAICAGQEITYYVKRTLLNRENIIHTKYKWIK